LIYSYRPLSELPAIIATAKELGAKTIWYQSGLNATGGRDPKGCWVPEGELQIPRRLAEAAGLRFTAEPHVAEVARGLRTG
jgi:sugar phosphate isomerase/epimerase